MKKIIKIIGLAVLFFAIPNVVCDKSATKNQRNICEAFSVFDMVSPKIVDFYESEIAGEKVVSDKSEKQIENIAQKYSISDKKAQGVLIVYDFCKRTGGGMDFPTIAKMSDGKIIALVRARAKVYEQSISEEKKTDLKRKSKEILGISI